MVVRRFSWRNFAILLVCIGLGGFLLLFPYRVGETVLSWEGTGSASDPAVIVWLLGLLLMLLAAALIALFLPLLGRLVSGALWLCRWLFPEANNGK